MSETPEESPELESREVEQQISAVAPKARLLVGQLDQIAASDSEQVPSRLNGQSVAFAGPLTRNLLSNKSRLNEIRPTILCMLNAVPSSYWSTVGHF